MCIMWQFFCRFKSYFRPPHPLLTLLGIRTDLSPRFFIFIFRFFDFRHLKSEYLMYLCRFLEILHVKKQKIVHRRNADK